MGSFRSLCLQALYLSAESALLPCGKEGIEVFLRLVGIGMGERARCLIHSIVVSEIGGNREAVTGPCMRTGKRPAAEGSQMCEAVGIDLREVGCTLAVPELAHVVVMQTPIFARKPCPAEQQV